MTSGTKAFPDGSAIPGHGFAYAYDGIGNRESAVHGGGSDTDVSYATNALNQYTSVGTDGGRFILGEAPAASPVTINDTIPAARAGGLGFFWHQITGTNASAPLWSQDKVSIPGKAPQQGRTWTPLASVVPIHDFDGNLTYDGRWDYVWDAENRLVRMTTAAIAYAAGVPRQRLDFVYDAEGRRVAKTVKTWDGTDYAFTSNRRFLYDGWNLIAEYSATSETTNVLTLDVAHTWGPDLSGTMQGAGGVGGLLSSEIKGTPSTVLYPAYDGNGNIGGWVDSGGQLEDRRDYSPFGQLIAHYKLDGTTAFGKLPFGFSTKYTDAESGLLYYGYRYYDPVTGRWPSRDPIEEEGGINLYTAMLNDAIKHFDILGEKIEGIVGANSNLAETDAERLSNLEKTRRDVSGNGDEGQRPTWRSRDQAGRYGARAAVFLTLRGPRRVNPSGTKLVVEYGGRICCRCSIDEDGKRKFEYFLTGPFTAMITNALPMVAYESCNYSKGEVEVGFYHSHPRPGGQAPMIWRY